MQLSADGEPSVAHGASGSTTICARDVDAGWIDRNRTKGDRSMSPRNTAHPPRTATARPGKSVRSSLIVKDKKKKRSAQDQSALDDRFHRTTLRFTGFGPQRT
jgi:hypothetical protein